MAAAVLLRNHAMHLLKLVCVVLDR